MAVAAAAWLGSALPDAKAAPARPNILVIVTDDQPLGTLGVMPATRRLFARGGRNYPNAYATTPLCCPSRASILTGLYAHNHGVLTQEPQSFDVRATIPRYLQRAGYLTGIAGKYLNRWGTSPLYTPISPPYFDLWSTTRPDPNGYRNTLFNENGRLRLVKEYSTKHIGRRTVEFLRSFEKRDARPWFIYTAFVAPHVPSIPTRAHRNAAVSAWPRNPAIFEADRSDKPPYVQNAGQTPERGQQVRARQLRSLMSVDDEVRQLFSELRRRREDRKTVAFFVSDNGFLWAQHGLVNKTAPYLPSVKIPFLVRWPARVAPRSVDRRIVANIDIAPTIARLTRLGKAAPRMDGRSLFSRRWTRDHLLIEYFKGDTASTPTWASLTAPAYQYVENYDEDWNVTFREYYDLVQDPWQLVNTLGDFDPTNDPSPAMLAELSARVVGDRACAGSSCP